MSYLIIFAIIIWIIWRLKQKSKTPNLKSSATGSTNNSSYERGHYGSYTNKTNNVQVKYDLGGFKVQPVTSEPLCTPQIKQIESQLSERVYKKPPIYSLPCYEIPLSVKAALGQMAADAVPLSAEWAFAWIETDPMTYLRTPAQRCKEEFRKLFYIRYSERFGAGYKLKVNKTKLKTGYRYSNTSSGNQLNFNNLPDVTVLKEPISTLREIAKSCETELDAFSRYLGRKTGTKDSIEAAALLPQALLTGYEGKEYRNIIDLVKELSISEQHTVINLSKILQFVPSINRDNFSKREATALVQVLSKMGIGMEPDLRFNNLLLKKEQDVILFKLPDESMDAPSKEYMAATILVKLASAVAHADGHVAPEEKHNIEKHLETWFKLSVAEKIRLKAYTNWLLSSCPNLSGIKKHLEVFNQQQKETIGKFLVGIAQSDGYVDPEEIKILTKIYDLLGLTVQDVFSHTHSAATDPVTIETAEVTKQGYALPPQSGNGDKGINLDMDTVEAKLAETVVVSSLLNNIFTDVDEPVAIKRASDSNKIGFAGLDIEISEFMRLLASRLSWARDELENIASEKKLMLDGTLDSINDASFDHFGGPFFEGYDPIEINPDYAKEIAV